MSIEVIIILLVALLAAGTLLTGWAGIRSIQQARKVVFYRTRRSYMTSGWQWLLLALVLFSSTVASALFGEPVVNQFLAPSAQASIVPSSGLPTQSPTSFLANLNERTATPVEDALAASPTLRQIQTKESSQTETE